MKTSVELRAARMPLWERMKAIHTAAEAENRPLTAEEETNWSAARDELKTLKDQIDRVEFLESTPATDEDRRAFDLRRDAISGPPKSETEAKEREDRRYDAAFRDYLSCKSPKMLEPETWEALYQGERQITAEERKTLATMLTPEQYKAAMSVGSQTGGGFWVPQGMMQRIEAAMRWFGGMRQFAEVITTDDGADIPWPVVDDTANTGRRLGEGVAATQTDLTVGVRVLKAYMYSSDEVLVSFQLLQDRPDLAEGILADLLGERVSRAQNTDFTTNAAADGPLGLVPAVSSALTAAATGAVTADELQRLKYAVNRAYRSHPSSAYMMSDASVGACLRLTDGNGNYLFAPDPRVGEEDTIWRSPVIVNDDVPAMATGVKSVLFGKGHTYKVRDVKGFSLLRLDERYAPSLQSSFLGFARADGGYINAGQNPIQCITQA